MREILFGFLMLSVLAAGCILEKPSPPSTSVPSDFEVRYSYGACHAEWGTTNIIIDSNGNGIYQSGSGTMLSNGHLATEKTYKTFLLNQTQMLGLLNSIEKNNFYSLNSYYSDPMTADGGCTFISVTQNNKTKSVSVSNVAAPEAFSKTADAISAVVPH